MSESRSISIVDDPEYWQALGKFVEQFATVESILFAYVASVILVSPAAARSIWPGTRTAELIEFIRRLWRAEEIWNDSSETGKPVSEIHTAQRIELDPVLGQLKTINTVRNSVIHYATVITSDKGRISSNVSRAITWENVKEHRATSNILGQMTKDLEKIGFHLASFIMTWKSPFAERAKNWPLLNNAWLYKSEQDQ